MSGIGTGTPLTCVPTMPRMVVTGSVARVTSRPISLAVVSVYLLPTHERVDSISDNVAS